MIPVRSLKPRETRKGLLSEFVALGDGCVLRDSRDRSGALPAIRLLLRAFHLDQHTRPPTRCARVDSVGRSAVRVDRGVFSHSSPSYPLPGKNMSLLAGTRPRRAAIP